MFFINFIIVYILQLVIQVLPNMEYFTDNTIKSLQLFMQDFRSNFTKETTMGNFI